MKLPFPFLQDVPEFKARHNILASDVKARIDEGKLVESLDILEQKADFTMAIAVKAWNVMIILSVVLLATQGPQILGLILKWAPVFKPE